MANVINMPIDDGLLRFTFTNTDDEIIAKFRLNPADVKLGARCEEISEWINAKANDKSINDSFENISKYNDEIEEKICYLLGYDAKADLFSYLSATTILPDGSLFAMVVMDKIIEAIKPVLEKRKKKMQASVNKYTAKYHKC